MKELKYLFKFYKKYRWRFAAGIFFVVTSNIFALYPAIYTRKAFDVDKEGAERTYERVRAAYSRIFEVS